MHTRQDDFQRVESARYPQSRGGERGRGRGNGVRIEDLYRVNTDQRQEDTKRRT